MKETLPESILPRFTEQEKKDIKGAIIDHREQVYFKTMLYVKVPLISLRSTLTRVSSYKHRQTGLLRASPTRMIHFGHHVRCSLNPIWVDGPLALLQMLVPHG